MLNEIVAERPGVPARPLPMERRLFSAVLDCFDTGVVLLGEYGDVVYANGAMRALERLGVFALRPSSLAFAERGANEAFGRRLRMALEMKAEAPAFIARDPAGVHTLVLRVIPSSCEAPDPQRSGTIVLATDPAARILGDRRLFEIGLGLSPAEAGVAVALLEGLAAKEVAARLHVSHETVRTHLKRLFEKTRTRRQAELLLVLLQVARVGVYPFEGAR